MKNDFEKGARIYSINDHKKESVILQLGLDALFPFVFVSCKMLLLTTKLLTFGVNNLYNLLFKKNE